MRPNDLYAKYIADHVRLVAPMLCWLGKLKPIWKTDEKKI